MTWARAEGRERRAVARTALMVEYCMMDGLMDDWFWGEFWVFCVWKGDREGGVLMIFEKEKREKIDEIDSML